MFSYQYTPWVSHFTCIFLNFFSCTQARHFIAIVNLLDWWFMRCSHSTLQESKMSNYFFKKKRSIFWGAFDWLADVSANHSQLWRLLISAHPSSAAPRLCLLWLNVDCLTLVNENDENPEFDESVGDVPDVASMFFYSLFMLAGLSLPVKRLWTQAE